MRKKNNKLTPPKNIPQLLLQKKKISSRTKRREKLSAGIITVPVKGHTRL